MLLFAGLFESRVLFITLDGEMGMLAAFGEDANFVISVGGFHPSFTPPPLPFPTPKRIALDILNESDARIRVDTYFAVTTNTVQFGAHAELVFGFDDFGLHGHLGFDALFQFSPSFYFIIQIGADLSLEAFGVGVFSVDLDFALEGPTPWRARGHGSISLLFFDISADFDRTWGETRDTTLPAIDVMPQLATEFGKLENWKSILPANTNLLVSLRHLDETEGLVLHPLGTLQISQRLLPLDSNIDKLGAPRVQPAPELLARPQDHLCSAVRLTQLFPSILQTLLGSLRRYQCFGLTSLANDPPPRVSSKLAAIILHRQMNYRTRRRSCS